ncbi:hypothetical protein ES319_A02G115400v1 [Gossypium barbadense]|uniref:Uncharacterized protein n=1 Tax=Gossypium barbadense TaxID=3634 RepID=A0A5J5WME7_GOSBA|nr:hypothetical protein ES319_A02G115400v1 [Gossypium barbadense]
MRKEHSFNILAIKKQLAVGFLLYHHRHIEAERALTIQLYLYAFNISYFTNEKNIHLRKNTLPKQLKLYCDLDLNSSY